MRQKHTIRDFYKHQKGVAALEFVLCIPLLILLFAGAIEVSRLFLAIQKVEKTVDLVTDSVARSNSSIASEALSTANLNALMSSVPAMMSPYAFGPNGVLILTDVTVNATGGLDINWQYCGGGTLTAASKVGTASGTAAKTVGTMPIMASPLLPGEEIIIGEIYYNFSPILAQEFLGGIQLYRVVIFVPRSGTLSGFVSKC